jgi:hypothetical protein
MDSDEVSSIDDTVESQQVAKVVRTAYFDIINRARLPEHYDLRQLNETSSSTPVIMTVPSDVDHIEYVKYDWATATDPEINMQLLTFKPMQDFLDMQDRLDPTATDVDSLTLTVGSDNHTILFKNNGPPRYYTTTDDNKVLFDSYDNEVETFLRQTKSRAYCRLSIPWTMVDSFTPDLDEPQFALLLNEAKSLAWAELKQSPHSKAEQSARRAWTQLQKNKHAVGPSSDFDRLPNFGRL